MAMDSPLLDVLENDDRQALIRLARRRFARGEVILP